MAQKTTITYFSDLSGVKVDGDCAGVQFGLDGTTYEIDLTAKEQKALRDVLAPYVDAGRKVGGATRRRQAGSAGATDGSSAKEIRVWALANGHEVPARGRIPALALEAYKAAH
jgi:hypothetical protein